MAVKYHLDEWEEWIRPYIKKCSVVGREELFYYAVQCVPFRLMVEHSISKYIKWKIRGRCTKCGCDFVSEWHNMWIRKAFKGEEVCGRCARGQQFTEQWKKNNSEAQRKVQGTPEARERMSLILKESWANDPDRKIRISRSMKRAYENDPTIRKKISEASKRNWKRPEYQEKVTGHGYYHGWFLGRCGRIFFASSWELMFLIWCEENNDIKIFERNKDRIPYSKPCGGVANYHPDFQIETGSGKTIIEIKGKRSDLDLVERKRIAAEKFYNGLAGYIILYKEDMCRMGIYRENKIVGQWISQLVHRGKVECLGYGKYKDHDSFENFIKQENEKTDKRKQEKENRTKNNRLHMCFPKLLSEWDYSRNILLPTDVPYWFGKKVHWKCSVCGFMWETTVSSRTKSNPTGCPQCAKKRISESMSKRLRDAYAEKIKNRNTDSDKELFIKAVRDAAVVLNRTPTRELFLCNSNLSHAYMYQLFGSYTNLLKTAGIPLNHRESNCKM